MKRSLSAVLLYLCSVVLYGTGYNIVNEASFGLGREWGGTEKNIKIDKMYFENRTDIDLFRDNVTAFLRLQAADPGRNNESEKGLTRFNIGYANQGFSVRAGDNFEYFARGVVLGLRESSADFFDSSVRGGSIGYSGEFFSLKAIGGKSYFQYIDDLDPLKPSIAQFDNIVLGSELILPLSDYFGFEDLYFAAGGSFLFIEGDDSTPEDQYLYGEMFIRETSITGFSFEAESFGLELFTEYALKETKRTPVQTGWANYTSLSYSRRGFGIDLEFKDYYKYGANPNDLMSPFTPYQNVPELNVVHSSNLLNTHPHIVNANDEIGYKLSVTLVPSRGSEIRAYAALASMHDGNSFFPSFSDNLLPHRDIWASWSYSSDNFSLMLGGGHFIDSPLSKGYNLLIAKGIETAEDVYSDTRNTVSAEYGFRAGDRYGAVLKAEYQKVHNSFYDKNYEDIFGSVEFSVHNIGYINLSVISTTDKVPSGSPSDWIGIEAGFDILNNHKISIFYGRERAGIKCAGGSCRQVPEFDGFRIGLTSYFN